MSRSSAAPAVHASCPVCGGRNLRDKYVINDFSILRCLSCELLFVKEIPTQQELDYHYGKAADGMAADEDCVYLNRANDENLAYYYRRLRDQIVRSVPAGRILDIGCNAGQFLDVMEGFERYGIERSPLHGPVAREKYGEKIFIGTFEDYPAPAIPFDCITLQDVLDHMVDPLEALRKCHSLLKPNGLLIVKVHDISCLYAKLSGKNFYAFLPPLHLFYFSRPSLKMALEKASFTVVRALHMSHLIFLSTIFYRLARGNPESPFFALYRKTEGTWLGRRRIHKNLHDIITVFAVKG